MPQNGGRTGVGLEEVHRDLFQPVAYLEEKSLFFFFFERKNYLLTLQATKYCTAL